MNGNPLICCSIWSVGNFRCKRRNEFIERERKKRVNETERKKKKTTFKTMCNEKWIKVRCDQESETTKRINLVYVCFTKALIYPHLTDIIGVWTLLVSRFKRRLVFLFSLELRSSGSKHNKQQIIFCDQRTTTKKNR